MPTPVTELKMREETNFPVRPGTNEEEALRVLAANPELGWTPKEVAERTTITESSITKTMKRLYKKTLVDRVQGTYFVKQGRLDEIQGVLGDHHGLRTRAREKHQTPVHPEEPETSDEQEDEEYEQTSETEGDAIVYDALDEEVEEVPPSKVFAPLSDPTRIAILYALWEADDHMATFSELRTMVEMSDSGQFNYHLSKLRGQFLSHTDNGYRLRLSGSRIVGALLSGAYTQMGETGSVTMDQSCPSCDGLLTFQYEDEQAVIDCDDCDGFSMKVPISPGVFAGYEHEALPDVSEQYTRNLIRQAEAGFCMICEGRVNPQVEIEGPSDAENLSRIPMVHYECERCGEVVNSDLGTALLDHPDVIAFYHDHDIDVRETSIWQFVAADEDSLLVLQDEPLQMNVVYTVDGDRLIVTVDESLDVLATERNR